MEGGSKMKRLQKMGTFTALLVALTLVLTACGSFTRRQSSDIPELPFPDNPNPEECGIPVQWGSNDPAWLNGYYEGELVRPMVFMYDSHLRKRIQGSAPHGTEVRVVLYQRNPDLNYYMVRTVGTDSPQEGWVPAPFVSFDPVN